MTFSIVAEGSFLHQGRRFCWKYCIDHSSSYPTRNTCSFSVAPTRPRSTRVFNTRSLPVVGVVEAGVAGPRAPSYLFTPRRANNPPVTSPPPLPPPPPLFLPP